MASKVTLIQSELIIRLWNINRSAEPGHPNYFFGEDKQLYRFDTRGRIQRNKRVVIGTTQGYILKRKFFSLAQLRPLLRRHEPGPMPW